MSSQDPKITLKGINDATEIIKEALRSPAAAEIFKRLPGGTSADRIIHTHEAIARHLSSLEIEANGGAADFDGAPLVF